MSAPKALTFVNKVWKSFLETSGMEPHLLKTLSIDSAKPGQVDATLKILPHHCNRLGIVHGGVLSCLVDTGGSLALASRGLYSTGVSTDLSVTYIRSAGVAGQTLNCQFTCDALGRTMAYTRSEFSSDKGKLVARGNHTKYVAVAREHEKNDLEHLLPDKKERVEEPWFIPY